MIRNGHTFGGSRETTETELVVSYPGEGHRGTLVIDV
jgi:hypothetical protein